MTRTTAIRAVIADDEPPARRRILALLESHPDIVVAAECADGIRTVQAVLEHRPDLLFLDVQMPRMDGFEVLESLGIDRVPVVIFTTAHDRHALKAFDVHALDYLLKPFAETRFRAALERARTQLLRPTSSSSERPLGSLLAEPRSPRPGGSRIPVRLPDRLLFVPADRVRHVEAAGNYVVLHDDGERHVVRETMSAMERRLVPVGFHRISRSSLVNLRLVRELQTTGDGEYAVVLRDGTRLSMTCPLRELQARMTEL